MNAVNDQERDIDNPASSNYVPDPSPAMTCQELEDYLLQAAQLRSEHETLATYYFWTKDKYIHAAYVTGYDKKIALYNEAITKCGSNTGGGIVTTTSNGSQTTQTTSQIQNFIQSNPLILAGGVFLLLIFFTRKKQQ